MIKQLRKPEYDRLLKLNDDRVTVGVHEEEGSKTHPNPDEKGEPITVAEVAANNEFGLGVPQRSWLRGWVDTTDFQQVIKVTSDDAAHLAETIAPQLEASIKARIRTSIPPPNAPRTIQRKGHGNTLIDTETFINAIKAK